MTKEQIELDARLMAIENMVQMLFASEYIEAGWSIAKVEEQHKEMIAQARKETFPSAGPALSDHFAAEYEQNTIRLLRGVVEKMQARQPR